MNPATTTSPKVILMTIAALVAPAILAGLEYLQTDPGRTLFATLSPLLVVEIGAVVSGLATFLAGFIKSDPLRNGATGLSPKVLLASLATVAITAILAGLQYLQTPDGQSLFHALPPVLVVTIGALITSATTFITGYFKTDPARTDAPRWLTAGTSTLTSGNSTSTVLVPTVNSGRPRLIPDVVEPVTRSIDVDEGPDPDNDPPVSV